jgi:tRNA(fMet)-specific endonuclease VapC
MANRLYLLDTDVISYYLRGGHPALNERLRFMPYGSILVSAISAAELLSGIRDLPLRHPVQLDVEGYLETANVVAWPVSAAAAYADIRYALGRFGKDIGVMDMMIAAPALAADLTLVSNNTRHYERLAPPLRLENWTEA